MQIITIIITKGQILYNILPCVSIAWVLYFSKHQWQQDSSMTVLELSLGFKIKIKKILFVMSCVGMFKRVIICFILNSIILTYL